MAVNQIKLSEIYSEEYLEKAKGEEVEVTLEKGGMGSGRHKLYLRGGSIGERKEGDHPKHGKLVSEHESLEEAKDKAKRYNKMLSPGEKSYYKLKYHVVSDKGEDKVEKAESISTTIGLSEYNPSTTIGNNPHLVKAFKQVEPIDYSKIKQQLDSKLEKGMIDNDLHTKAIDQLNSLVKAKGEGSRGGHVIGHTKSGKPVYQGKDQASSKEYKDFTAQDHKDAESLHAEEAVSRNRQAGATSGAQSAFHDAMYKHHKTAQHNHNQAALKLEKEGHEKSLSADEKKILADQKKKQIEHHEEAIKHHEDIVGGYDLLASKSGLKHNNPHIKEEYERSKKLLEHHKQEVERLKKD